MKGRSVVACVGRDRQALGKRARAGSDSRRDATSADGGLSPGGGEARPGRLGPGQHAHRRPAPVSSNDAGGRLGAERDHLLPRADRSVRVLPELSPEAAPALIWRRSCRRRGPSRLAERRWWSGPNVSLMGASHSTTASEGRPSEAVSPRKIAVSRCRRPPRPGPRSPRRAAWTGRPSARLRGGPR